MDTLEAKTLLEFDLGTRHLQIINETGRIMLRGPGMDDIILDLPVPYDNSMVSDINPVDVIDRLSIDFYPVICQEKERCYNILIRKEGRLKSYTNMDEDWTIRSDEEGWRRMVVQEDACGKVLCEVVPHPQYTDYSGSL